MWVVQHWCWTYKDKHLFTDKQVTLALVVLSFQDFSIIILRHTDIKPITYSRDRFYFPAYGAMNIWTGLDWNEDSEDFLTNPCLLFQMDGLSLSLQLRKVCVTWQLSSVCAQDFGERWWWWMQHEREREREGEQRPAWHKRRDDSPF